MLDCMVDNTQDKNSGGSDPKDEFYNMKENFNEKMKEYSNKSDDVIKKPWTNATVEEAIREILDSNNTKKRRLELSAKWSDCKIVHGRLRHPQSQGSVERCNQDIENMLRAWIIFGTEPKSRLGSTDILPTVLENTDSKDLERFKNGYKEREMTSGGEEDQVANLEHEMLDYKIVTERQKAHEGQKKAAKNMIQTSGKKLKSVADGDFVLLDVLKVDRDKMTDEENLEELLNGIDKYEPEEDLCEMTEEQDFMEIISSNVSGSVAKITPCIEVKFARHVRATSTFHWPDVDD
ncbi:hypothetical protein ILUMI_27508 [Ignelater luminosus]|uniref:Uncharacterized protein n=1 Tax=Ignelater luminosus TaxID=2038154 RepID=A0A8K0FXQ9_IGNLU|nr:hypothetical protein ILUMI_27508 [Ignelater luminosus]